MKKIAILLAITFTSQVYFGQKKVRSDSILEMKIDSLNLVAQKFWSKDLDSAEIVTNYMLTFSEKNNYERGKAKAYSSFGVIKDYRGFQGESMSNYIKAARIFEEIGDQLELAILNYNIGVSLVDLKELKEAREYVEKAHKYYLEVNNKKQLTYSYSTLAYIDLNTDKSLKEVISKLKEAERIAIETKDTLMWSTALYQQGGAYIERNKKFDLAISQLQKALQLIKKKDPENHFYLGVCYNFLGEVSWKMKDYNKALSYNDSSLVNYKSLNLIQTISYTYGKRKDILVGLGKYKESIEAFELYSKYKDSAFQIDKINELSRVKIEYETEQITAEKETAETKVKLTEAISQKNRNLFLGSLGITGLLILASLFYFSRLKAKKKAELITIELKETQKRLALEKQYKDSELKALKAQMNPHFIFNALNSIQDYIVLNQKNLASDYLGKFADLIRNYLHFSDTGFISIPDEVHNLNLYLELEKLRFEEELNYTFKVDKSINSDSIKIPTMLIQPYVENALKHGLLHRKKDKKLIISIHKHSDGIIECIIEDNGVGRAKAKEINAKKILQHQSFASKATSERLDLLNFGKDQKIGVSILDLKEGRVPK